MATRKDGPIYHWIKLKIIPSLNEELSFPAMPGPNYSLPHCLILCENEACNLSFNYTYST